MAESNPVAYYRQREQQERRMACAAKSAAIGAIHADMADRYLAMCGPDQACPQRIIRSA